MAIFILGPFRFYLFHLCKPRTLAAPCEELQEHRLFSFNFNIYRTIRLVARRARNAQLFRFLVRGIAEPDALHAAADSDV